jgi:DNA-binding MarR family transcriptional regulator
MATTRSGTGLHEVVHQRVRLGVLAVLARRGRATFTELRDALGQSDGGLSRHLGVLEQHALISTEKVFENRRPRTWVTMTDAGAAAFKDEQAQLAELLETATATSGDQQDVAMAVVFAALLDGDGRSSSDGVDHSALVPTEPLIAGELAEPIASGAVSDRYEFPEHYADFGREQREQRLMMISHGLRGGWVATWRTPGASITAQAMVLELGAPSDCDAILGVMGAATVDLPGTDGIRGYVLPAAAPGAPTTGIAWFAVGRMLASTVVLVEDEDDTASALADLVVRTTATMTENGS